MSLVRKIGTVTDTVSNVLAFLAGVILVFIMLGTAAEVALRYLVGSSIPWMMEIVEYSLVFMTFFAATWLLKHEGHVMMDIIIIRLGPKAQALTHALTSMLGAIVCLVIGWYGIEVTWFRFKAGTVLGTVLEPPMFILLWVIPLGSLLLFIQFLRRSYKYLRKHKESISRKRKKDEQLT